MTPTTKGSTWQPATFRLPVSQNLPVEVELFNGKKEKRDTLEGSWNNVLRWRPLGKNAK